METVVIGIQYISIMVEFKRNGDVVLADIIQEDARLKSSVEIYTDVCLAHTNTLEIQDRMFRKNPIFARLKWSRSA